MVIVTYRIIFYRYLIREVCSYESGNIDHAAMRVLITPLLGVD